MRGESMTYYRVSYKYTVDPYYIRLGEFQSLASAKRRAKQELERDPLIAVIDITEVKDECLYKSVYAYIRSER